ncbi:hypothetical protein GCM10011360_29870 [Primorskyibacter flagellatus]|uniref:Uncharacterized protein n=1 Tax=Primorskyibacter flagellatus TaxID=1387277 RepID=A0A917ABR1_9RHOB|nr:hypothetical protein [Primorskyibacter flagellatus]GGE40249.1 hypothetical protein GCM10011360_29870 [Primorskyibacter flagellatus]
MDKIAKPSPEELRRAQAALNALNQAYDYFTSDAPAPAQGGTAYLPYTRAA